MKTIPFNREEALAGRVVYERYSDNTISDEHGRVISTDCDQAWVKWANSYDTHPFGHLVHEDLTPEPKKPVNLLALNWPSIWVRGKGCRDATHITYLGCDSLALRGDNKPVGKYEFDHLEYAPTPAGPWRPMME